MQNSSMNVVITQELQNTSTSLGFW